ncbi:hypothetical protein EDC01DRAFT_634163 [Geopyxis carbonaria]|nr:hypothetical protein EDC01DRAFT_634163 [Geopyxis carbonaria]
MTVLHVHRLRGTLTLVVCLATVEAEYIHAYFTHPDHPVTRAPPVSLPVFDTLVARASTRVGDESTSCSPSPFTVTDRDREAALGQTLVLRTAFQLLDWVSWSNRNDIDTARFYRLIDHKVWTFVVSPAIALVDPEEVHQQLRSDYEDGFPDSWKNSDEAKATLDAFRQYAAFWFYSVYDRTKGKKLAAHREDFPEDFPDNELDAFVQVAKTFAPASNSNTLHSAAAAPEPTSPGIRSSRGSSSDRAIRRSTESQIVVSLGARPMSTKFPARIRADRLVGFDGKPQRIFSLDLSVEDMCGEHNYPGYYGETVLGNAEDGYNSVPESVRLSHLVSSTMPRFGGKTIGRPAERNLTAGKLARDAESTIPARQASSRSACLIYSPAISRPKTMSLRPNWS